MMLTKFILILFALLINTASGANITRPQNDGLPTKVQAFIFIIDLDNIDTAEQKFEANVVLLFKWHDPRLAHQANEVIRKPLTEVWNPRLQAVNQQKLWSTFPEQVEIKPNGEITYIQRVWGTFSQPLHLHDFPFDEQVFQIDIVAARFTPEEIEFVQTDNFPSGLAKNLSLPDWDIIGSESQSKPYQLAENTKIISGFMLKFTAKRRIDYYIVNIIIPLLLIVAMSWVVFWIDPKESGTQISVAITSMLTLIAYRFAIGANLPHLSYLTRLDTFILLSTLLVFGCLLEAVITTTLAKSDRYELALKIDLWCRSLFPVALFIVAYISLFYGVKYV